MPCRRGPDKFDDYHDPSVMRSVLCSVCRMLEEDGYDFDKNPALSEWWSTHKELDEIKRRDERRADELMDRPLRELSGDDVSFLERMGRL